MTGLMSPYASYMSGLAVLNNTFVVDRVEQASSSHNLIELAPHLSTSVVHIMKSFVVKV